MMACYLDESFDMKDRGVFVAGGWIGREAAWGQIDIEWEKLRNRYGIAYFKARECFFGTGEFRKFVVDPKSITADERRVLDGIREEFLKIIVNQPVIAFGIGIIQNDFRDVILDSNAKAILGDNPYWAAYHLSMIEAAWGMKNLEESIREDDRRKNTIRDKYDSEILSFVCDDHEEYSQYAYPAYKELRDNNPQASKYMGSFTHEDDRRCQPVQCADLIVGEIRRAILFKLGKYPTLSEEFKSLTDQTRMWLIKHANKQDLLGIVNANKAAAPLNLDWLMEQTIEENIAL